MQHTLQLVELLVAQQPLGDAASPEGKGAVAHAGGSEQPVEGSRRGLIAREQ